MSKYDPLSARLAAHTEDSWTVTFAGLEAVLGFTLPKTARSSDAWWSNTAERPHNLAWTREGWEAEADRAGETVTFRRKGAYTHESPQAEPEPTAAASADAPAWRRFAPALAGGAAVVVGLAAMALRTARRRR